MQRSAPAELLGTRCRRPVPSATRCCGSRRRTLRQAASFAGGYRAARAKPADRAAVSACSSQTRTTHPNVKWTTCATRANSRVRPMMRRSGGGGGWRSWWFELGSFGSALYYTSRAKRASSPWRGGTSNATLLGEGLRRPLLAASLRVGDLRGSSAAGFPIRSQNKKRPPVRVRRPRLQGLRGRGLLGADEIVAARDFDRQGRAALLRRRGRAAVVGIRAVVASRGSPF